MSKKAKKVIDTVKSGQLPPLVTGDQFGLERKEKRSFLTRIADFITGEDVSEIEQLRRELAVVRSQRDLMQQQSDEEIKQLNEMVIQREKDVISAMEMFKREEHENKLLREQLKPKPCDGCIHSANYRKCASCARYPKIKDKFEGGVANG